MSRRCVLFFIIYTPAVSVLSSPFASLPAFNEILLLENWLELNWDFNPIDVPVMEMHTGGNAEMEGRCNQETLVLGSPYNNESHQKLRAEPHVTVSNFKVFDHPHLRHSSGRVWLLKFSSLLPHLSIVTEAQNSHIGRSLFSLLHEEEANRLQNSWWYPWGALREH